MKTKIFLLIVGLVFLSTNVWAKSLAELAAESEAYCAETAKTKATPEMVVEIVNKAAKMVEKEGKAGLTKLMGTGSEYLFAGLYIWVHDLKGEMLMHPIKYKMIGKNMTGLKDKTGKRFIVLINKIAVEKGEGWISYLWPKPGAGKKVSPKVSYFKKARSADGVDMVLCCGVYDMLDELKAKGYEIQ